MLSYLYGFFFSKEMKRKFKKHLSVAYNGVNKSAMYILSNKLYKDPLKLVLNQLNHRMIELAEVPEASSKSRLTREGNI